ncbi:MAG: hypothetical protein EOP04_13765 [Proteobacteria bacterium]|nr:MAG: hypothetical protein EOP04_13765 [Pseudomonadota bacterium]
MFNSALISWSPLLTAIPGTPDAVTHMAEDQQWAEDILRAGFKKAYADNSLVIHSHSYSAKEWLHRTFDEYRSYFDLGLVQRRGFLSACKNAIWLWRRDARLLLASQKKSWAYLAVWLYRRFWISWAASLGQFFGTNFQKMPNSSLEFFSMQSRNKRSNR